MRVLYAGCDLHGNSNLIGIGDGEGKRVFKKKLSNDLGVVRDALKPFQEELVGIAVESTYNWYWMVDGLMETGPIHRFETVGDRVINVLTAHAVSHEGLANNHES